MATHWLGYDVTNMGGIWRVNFYSKIAHAVPMWIRDTCDGRYFNTRPEGLKFAKETLRQVPTNPTLV